MNIVRMIEALYQCSLSPSLCDINIIMPESIVNRRKDPPLDNDVRASQREHDGSATRRSHVVEVRNYSILSFPFESSQVFEFER